MRTSEAAGKGGRPKGPSIKYVTLFLANFNPPFPCHTSRDPPESTSHNSDPQPPIFLWPITKNPYKSFLVQILSQLFAGDFVRGDFVRGYFVWKVLSGVVFVRSRSVRIHLLHQKA